MEEDGVIFNVMIPLEVGFYFFFPSVRLSFPELLLQ